MLQVSAKKGSRRKRLMHVRSNYTLRLLTIQVANSAQEQVARNLFYKPVSELCRWKLESSARKLLQQMYFLSTAIRSKIQQFTSSQMAVCSRCLQFRATSLTLYCTARTKSWTDKLFVTSRGIETWKHGHVCKCLKIRLTIKPDKNEWVGFDVPLDTQQVILEMAVFAGIDWTGIMTAELALPTENIQCIIHK